MNNQSKQLIAQFKLPSYIMGKSFADASKIINSKFEGRNDMVSNNTKNELLKRLADAQEFLKSQEQSQQVPQEQMAYGGFKDSIVGQAFGKDTTGEQEMGAVSAGLNTLVTGVDLAKSAFGKPLQDTSGLAPSEAVNTGGMVAGNALKGAQAGLAFGPIGAGIGAGVGAITGILGAGKAKKAAAENTANYAINVNKQFSDQYANGGPILPMRPDEREKSMERYKLLRASAIRGSGVKSDYKPNLLSPEETRAAYDDLRASALPGYKVNTGYKPDLRNPEDAMVDYLKARNNNVVEYAQGGGLTSEDRGSDKKPYPSISSGDFAGGGRSYPIPTQADAVDALRLAGLHGRSDVKAKVYAKYPSLKHAYGGPMKNTKLTFKTTEYDEGGPFDPEYYQNLKLTPRNTAPLELVGIKPAGLTYSTLPTTTAKIQQATPGPSDIDYLKYNVTKGAKQIGQKISDNSDLLRYAPAVMNAVQLAKLKKPSNVQLARLDNRYRPEYVDLAQSQNIANQELTNVNSAIQQSGASQGASRAAMLGSQLNKTKALSAAYADAQARNAQQDAMAQQFNLGVDQTNLGQSNLQQDINDRNMGNYDTQKSQLLAQLGNDIDNIGKEQLYKQYPKMMGLGYNWNGKYFINKDGDIKTKEDALALENTKSNGGYLNSDMISHINNMYIKRNKK